MTNEAHSTGRNLQDDRLGGPRQELAERATQKVQAFRKARNQVTGMESLAQVSNKVSMRYAY